MKNLLVAVPIKPDIHPSLKELALLNLSELVKETAKYCSVKAATYEYSVDDPDRTWRCAKARNWLLETYLTPAYDYVLWIDADITKYPPDLPQQLFEVHPKAVVAPLVLVENTRGFYDNVGFIENGGITETRPPYFEQTGRLIELDSVGCCYLIPADVYEHARYEKTPVDRKGHHWSLWIRGHTEHWSVMQKAKELGYSIWCTRDITVYHADLPTYGETWNK